jgi:hypothetical protein
MKEYRKYGGQNISLKMKSKNNKRKHDNSEIVPTKQTAT